MNKLICQRGDSDFRLSASEIAQSIDQELNSTIQSPISANKGEGNIFARQSVSQSVSQSVTKKV